MKYATVLAAVIATAVATPTGWGGGGSNPPPPSSQCNNNQQSVCCNGILGILCGVIDVIDGGACNGQSYCCDAGTSTGGLINLSLLNCVKL